MASRSGFLITELWVLWRASRHQDVDMWRLSSQLLVTSLLASGSGFALAPPGRYGSVTSLACVAPRRVAPPSAAAAAAAIEESQTKILYDGQCMVCLTNKALLSFFDKRKQRLQFVDIRDPGYDPSDHGGIEFADAMRHFHVIMGDQVRAA